MPWDEATWDHELRGWFQQLIRLRRTAPALRWGGFQLLYAAGDSVAYQREAPEERLIIVVRRADDGLRDLPVRHGGLADGLQLHELLTSAQATVVGGRLPLQTLPAPGVQIWRSANPV
jgi:alpha-glucosidase